MPPEPCIPSPCGPNTRCRTSGDNAVCECLPGFFGSPSSSSGCRPECVISADCARNRVCVNTKCVDPCPGVCGYGARCQVINHSPVCSCPPSTFGDPFVECKEVPGTSQVDFLRSLFTMRFKTCVIVWGSLFTWLIISAPPVDPCNPSPCRQNGQCRVINGAAVCQYPECVINQDCPRDKACFNQRCRDPCVDACGINAICQVVNHNAVCSCPPGYVGEPRLQCQRQQPVIPRKFQQQSGVYCMRFELSIPCLTFG